MAERRMFTKKVTDDDNFMALSSSAQALYLHLSMSADDDGFCNQVAVSMFKAHASVQDLQTLLEKRYIYQFETGVIVIKHWRMANALRKDRYTPTAFQEELSRLGIKDNGAYTWLPDGCQVVANCLPQDRIGEVREGKERIGEDREEETAPDNECPAPPPPPPPPPAHPVPYEEVRKLYNSLCPSLSRCTVLSDARKKAIKARFSSGYTLADFETLFTKTEASSFLKGNNKQNWRASFDWLVADKNMAKVLDGNYDEHGYSAAPPHNPPRRKTFSELTAEAEMEGMA